MKIVMIFSQNTPKCDLEICNSSFYPPPRCDLSAIVTEKYCSIYEIKYSYLKSINILVNIGKDCKLKQLKVKTCAAYFFKNVIKRIKKVLRVCYFSSFFIFDKINCYNDSFFFQNPEIFQSNNSHILALHLLFCVYASLSMFYPYNLKISFFF